MAEETMDERDSYKAAPELEPSMETPLKHPPPGKGQGQMVWKHEQLRLPPADAEQERRYCWGSNKKITTQAARVALAIACGDDEPKKGQFL
jgi:hypothetical protein